MPVPLSEMGSLSMMSPQNIQNIPRFSNLPPPSQNTYQNFTLIEDVLAMPAYNSNYTIPAFPHYTIASPPRPPLQGVPSNIYLSTPHPPVQTIVNDYNQQHPLTSHRTQYPPFAGAVPYLENAPKMDETVPMREGFSSDSDNLRTQNSNCKVIIFILCLVILFLLMYKGKEESKPIKFYY